MRGDEAGSSTAVIVAAAVGGLLLSAVALIVVVKARRGSSRSAPADTDDEADPLGITGAKGVYEAADKAPAGTVDV